MAKANVILFPSVNTRVDDLYGGLDIEVDPHPYYVDYVGRREDLISANIATAKMFPKLPKRTKDNFRQGHSKTTWSIERIKGGRFKVRHWPESGVGNFKGFLCEQAKTLVAAFTELAGSDYQGVYTWAAFYKGNCTLSADGVRNIKRIEQALIRAICLARVT